MNKKEFYDKLKDKKFDECVEILRKEIIDILSLKLKEKDSYFSYTTTSDLHKKTKKYLEEKYAIMAYKLYTLDIMDEIDEYALDELYQIYKELKNK